jgi:hypothetical protein
MASAMTLPDAEQDEGLTALSVNTAASEMSARAEIEGAMIIAKRFPRNEDNAFGRLLKSCSRPTFAGDAAYSFPRGNTDVTGPSVYLAKEAARLWGNIRYGMDVVIDDEERRVIRAWAWDVEANTRVSQDASFGKLIQRKGRNGGPTTWVKPDERDLRELTNKHGSIAVRNCLLSLLPSDLIEDALNKARATVRNEISGDPDAARKMMVANFAMLNVSGDDLQEFLGGPVAQATPDQMAQLRTIYKSVRDGNSAWREYVKPKDKPQTTTGTVDELSNPKGKMDEARKTRTETAVEKPADVVQPETKPKTEAKRTQKPLEPAKTEAEKPGYAERLESAPNIDALREINIEVATDEGITEEERGRLLDVFKRRKAALGEK